MGSACAGQSTATVTGNTTKKQEDAARAEAGLPEAKPTESAAAYVAKNGPVGRGSGFSIMPPAEAPDVTDKVLKAKRMATALKMLSGRGRKAAFADSDKPFTMTGGTY
jgi:hypothetical protein